MTQLHWLISTEAGLCTRILVGLVIFTSLGIADFVKHGQAATRWREYTVLLAAVLAALAYGAINDQVTSTISWEYFYYGKELEHVLGPETPPNAAALHWEAAKVGFKATWSAGLIFGVVLLLANNPWRTLPRLKNRQLIRLLPVVLSTAAVFGAIGGFLGYEGFLVHLAKDFQDMAQENMFRPRRFMCTWGIHLGSYIGGFAGTLFAACLIVRRRRRPVPRGNNTT